MIGSAPLAVTFFEVVLCPPLYRTVGLVVDSGRVIPEAHGQATHGQEMPGPYGLGCEEVLELYGCAWVVQCGKGAWVVWGRRGPWMKKGGGGERGSDEDWAVLECGTWEEWRRWRGG